MTTKDAYTWTEKCRKLLDEQPNRGEFTITRGGLETLVLDSERVGQANKASVELLLAARHIASDTTMMNRDSDAWLEGHWDGSLAQTMREIASGSLVPLGHDCSTGRERRTSRPRHS